MNDKSGKYALIIGTTEYIDPGLKKLNAPGRDVEDLARVLQDSNICGFDNVKILLNQLSTTVIEAIDEFFDQKKTDDLLVLYFSGHGIRDEYGSLYLGFKNTIRSRLRSTAIKDEYIRGAMDQSHSKRQVVVLDCCNSGAFPQGIKAELGSSMGLTSAFQGYGRFVLTASDATQFAWEGDKVIGKTDNSLFTHFIVQGLEGEADRDGDGIITVDELYDYVFDEISKATPKQTPMKSAARVEGEIILRQITRLQDIKPVPLPEDLISEIDDIRPYVRAAAAEKLAQIINGKNIGRRKSAVAALEKLIKDKDTTPRVAKVARQALKIARQMEGVQPTEEISKSGGPGVINFPTTAPEDTKKVPTFPPEQVPSNTQPVPVPMPPKPASKPENRKLYQNQANSDHPATLLYLVDISGSMNATMKDGKTRIEVAKNAIQVAYAQMIQRSMRQGKIHPRYRVGMIAYSDDIYDVYGSMGSIISIDKLKNEGVPAITPQKSTNMAKAFRYAAKLIKEDLQKWPEKWLKECPPPMVINITDCEFDEKEAQDPFEPAQKIKQISIPDGNVLVENIFITDQISVPVSSQEWQGYQFSDSTGDLYGDKLLSMSSPIPSSYAQILREQAGFKINDGAAMMFPGITREFIKFGFAMSIVTGAQISQPARSPMT